MAMRMNLGPGTLVVGSVQRRKRNFGNDLFSQELEQTERKPL
jgi:hypothetical protein